MESEKEDDEEDLVVDAREVYLLMNEDVRISRNARANWFFSNIHNNFRCSQGEVTEELQVIAARGPRTLFELEADVLYRVTPATSVTFLSSTYRFVFVLDMSPSITAVDLSSSTVLYEETFSTLQKALRILIKPVHLPGRDTPFTPKIYVTVIAHTSLVNCKANQVLLQGCLVLEENLESILDQLRRDLDLFENSMASSLGETLDMDYYEGEDENHIIFGLFEDTIDRPNSPDPSLAIMSPEASFINILRYGILALQLLPENSAAGIVVITDGVVGVPDHNLFESLMMQLRHTAVSCTFIQLGGGFQLQAGLGHIPYPELLQFISAATMGAHFTKLCSKEVDKDGIHPLQSALLTQRFQKQNRDPSVLCELDHTLTVDTNSLVHGQTEDVPQTTLHSRKHRDRNLHIPISSIISCRLREGYFIKDVVITKGETQIEVRMTLPWRNCVNVQYLALSNWPLNNSKRHCHVEVSVEGSYEFLRDMTSHLKQKSFKSSYRTGLIKRYWQTLQIMSETDDLLVHLHSLATNSVYYKVPDSLKQGVPLFYLPPHQTSPRVNIQLSTKDLLLNQFASFWRPVLMLDINIWQKWMHTHRIGFILEHDEPLGKHLHIPNSSGRFHNSSCRHSSSALNFFLRDYSTFVLMENHSYVTLLFREEEKAPWSFFVIRVASKPPCMVLRIAFLGGTPGQERKKVINDLKTKLGDLSFQQPRPSKDDGKEKAIMARRASIKPEPDTVKKHNKPVQVPTYEIPCCVLTRKPIEKILIRYERMPHDFTTIDISPLLEHSGHSLPITANKVAFNIYTTLSRYLFHRRWVWSVQHGSTMPVSMQAIGRILSNLTKIRLLEGFNFAHTSSGIVNLVVELDMKGTELERSESTEDQDDMYPCVLQYVVFPPHTTTTRGSIISEEETEEIETAEADGELQIITECWIEPQWGVVVNSMPERKHIDGLSYREVAQTMFPTDLDCISTMITFEHLNLMCQSLSVPSPALLGTPLPNLSMVEEVTCMSADVSIQTVPFPFDLLRLLPKCQQVELLFSTYIQEFKTDVEEDPSNDTVPSKDAPEDSRTTTPRETQTQQKLETDTEKSESQTAENDDQQSSKSECPNNLLFSLFLENLKDVHDREIHMTDFECEQLVSLIHQRDRDDDHPVPFTPRTLAMPEENTENKEPEFHRSESVLSMSTSFSVSSVAAQSGMTFSTIASQSQTAGSQSGIQRLTSAQGQQAQRVMSPLGREVESGPEISKTSTQTEPAEKRVIPRWRCFVRSLTSTHIMLCFTPASLNDLLMLIDVGSQLKHDVLDKHGSYSSKRSSVGGASSHPLSPSEVKTDRQDSHEASQVPEPSTTQDKPEDVPSPDQIQDKDSSESPVQPADTTGTTDPVDTQSKVKPEDNEEKSENNVTHIETVQSSESQPVSSSVDQTTGEAEVQSEDVSGPCADLPSGYLSVPLPVYVYNCPLSYLSEQLVNKLSFSRPDDIFEDLTFKSDQGGPISGPAAGTASVGEGMEEAGPAPRQRKISELDGRRLGTTQEDVYHKAKELKQHCTMVSETFLRCFVKGLYQCLLLGSEISCHDIDAAINEICEESLPLEIDISRFLQCSCAHVRQVIEKANLEKMLREDWCKTLPKVMTKPAEEELFEDPIHSDMAASETESRASLQIPLPFPLEILKTSADCGSTQELHQLIRQQFEEIVHNFFKPVSENSDYYYFCPPSQIDKSSMQDSPDIQFAADGLAHDRDPKTFLSGDSAELEVPSPHEKDFDDIMSVQSNKDSISSGSGLGLGDLEDLDEDYMDKHSSDCLPLFVHLACSVRTDRSPLRTIPIKRLPMCFNDIEDCLIELDSTVDLNTVRVTLDIICLTLPEEEDLSENFHRPCYTRMVSHTSQMSHNSSGGDDDIDMISSIPDSRLQRSTGGDPLSHLPPAQREAVLTCKDQVLWLLKDEICSIMRCIVPVTADTLDMVANHVRTSDEKPMCSTKQVPLKFVGGSEKSLRVFIEEFERMTVSGFHLNRESLFYYLSIDRSYCYSQLHAKALQNALSHLDDVSSTDLRDISTVKNELSTLSAHTKTEQENKGLDKDQTQDVKQLQDLTSKLDSDLKTKSNTHQDHEAETVDILCPDLGLEVITEQRSPEHSQAGMLNLSDNIMQESCDEQITGILPNEQMETETFRAEDIKISVTRPSPIKELSKVEDVVLEQVKADADDEYLSDKSTGSSIQVLDDKTEADQAAYYIDQDLVPAEQTILDQIDSGEPTLPTQEQQCQMTRSEQISRLEEVSPQTFKQEESRLELETSAEKKSEMESETMKISTEQGLDSSMGTGVSQQLASDALNQQKAELEMPSKNCNISGQPGETMKVSSEHSMDSSSGTGISQQLVSDVFNQQKTELEMPTKTRNISGHSSGSRHSSGGRGENLTGSRHSSGSKFAETMSPYQSDKSISREGLSPLTVMAMEGDQQSHKSIRRAHSSASFEKYRHEKSTRSGKSSNPQTPSLSGWSTPQRRPSGSHTPSRSRHHSGLQTPMSTIETSSRSSIGDDGYEGDSSDMDEDGAMISFNETQTLRKPVLPEFWLIMKIEKDRVDVFFHTRDNRDLDQDCVVHYKTLYNQMIAKIIATCVAVNQKMLLEDLYSTRMCNNLLVPEADEEVRWGRDSIPRESRRPRNGFDSDDSDGEGQKSYFDAARDTDPGHFACDCVWQTSFVLHPRLKTGQGRAGMSRGIQTLRYSVLNKFAVNNRNNMFVIKENSTNSTGAVFYLRLEETPGDLVSMTTDSQKDEDWSASKSSSLLSLNLRKIAEQDDVDPALSLGSRGVEYSSDPVNQNKRPVLSRQKSEDIITLSAHGIGTVGPEISKDLVELLQKKLDDAVLKILTEILARNPMCKLTPEDVQFIQPRNCSPQRTLAFTIPPSAMLQQFALSYYLQQNIQQFVHTPKYMDNNQADVFLDYTQKPPKPIAEDYVFLYNRPQQSGGNGIACLHLSFVDGRGNSIQLITSPKPSCYAYKDPIDSSMYDNLINSSLYEIERKTPGKSPGPTALMQFTIWTKGTVDISSLTDQLAQAMKYAVCDVITEYRLLTGPICEAPVRCYKGIHTPTFSAPPSPGIPSVNPEPRHSVSSADIKKQFADSLEKTPRDKLAFFLQSLVLQDKDGASSLPTNTLEPEPSQPDHHEVREKIEKYETGEKGTLLPLYYQSIVDWFQYCCQLKVPTVTRQRFVLSNRFPLDYILKDLVSSIQAISQDMTARVFKEVLDSDDTAVYLPYSPSNRGPIGKQDKLAVSTSDPNPIRSRTQQHPGSSSSFVMIGRNIQQWRASVDFTDYNEERNVDLPALTNPKTHKSYQKFKPLDSSSSTERADTTITASPDRSNRDVVPRQRLMLIIVNDKNLTLYLYNWATELCSSLERQVLRLIQWHNARSQLLLSMFSQKMGLFQHSSMRGVSLGDQAMTLNESNPFTQAYCESDLVKYTCPPSQPSQTRGRSNLIGPGGLPVYTDDVYRDQKPCHPMQRSGYSSLRDPVHRHGAQLLEHINFVKKDSEKKISLQKLYLDWQQRMTTTVQIPEDILDLLKKSSRLIHSVATPLLFSPQWRKKVLGKKDPPKRPEPPAVENKQSRSRHSSGASVKSRRSGSIDGGRWRSHSSVDSPDISSRPQQEEAWHQEIREYFISQYTSYLQTCNLGILPVKTRPPTSHKKMPRTSRATEKKGQNTTHSSLKPKHVYLQKTLPGGIMLIEVGFSEEYFCINVYAFEVSSLSIAKSVNQQLALMFTDECEKFKDLTRAHSFSHDFHLRLIHNYIQDGPGQTFQKSNYHVTGFLKDFIQQYPHIPSSAQNYIYEGSLFIEDTSSPGQQLFEYMLQHDKMYNMRNIKMISADPSESETTEEFGLVAQIERPTAHEVRGSPTQRVVNPQDYLRGVIIAHEPLGDLSPRLHLRYWVILVNAKQTCPDIKKDQRRCQSKVMAYSADLSMTGCKTRGDSITSQSSFDLTGSENQSQAGSSIVPLDGSKSISDSSGNLPQKTTSSKRVEGMGSRAPRDPSPATSGGISQLIGSTGSASSQPGGSDVNSLEGASGFGSRTARDGSTSSVTDVCNNGAENFNYLGYSNWHQKPVYELLLKEAQLASETIEQIVCRTITHCRRDLLWQRMLLGEMAEEEEKRKRHRTGDYTTEPRDPYMTKLSFHEFVEMLEMVTRTRVSGIDAQLRALENMPTSWFQSLGKVLTQKYTERLRCFSSPDNIIQHYVVLNPKQLDMLMMLSVDMLSEKNEMCFVYKEQDSSAEQTRSETTVLLALELFENFINTACYHLWTGLV